jgi:hypothetical protein
VALLGKKPNPEWRRMHVTFEYSVRSGSRNDGSTYCSSQHSQYPNMISPKMPQNGVVPVWVPTIGLLVTPRQPL